MQAQAKKYLVNSMNEAMSAIKRDLGDDAVILNTSRNVSGMMEVIASSSKNMKKKYEYKKNVDRIKELEKQVNDIYSTISKLVSSMNDEAQGNDSYSDNKILIRLQKLGIAQEIIDEIIPNFNNDMADLEIKGKLIELLEKKINKKNEDEHDIFMFIGPTGVGKTTSLAKIASEYAFGDKEEIVAVNLDYLRQGARDQFEKYFKILNAEVHKNVLYEGTFNRIIDESIDKKVFIDTSGRSQYDENGMEETLRIIKSIKRNMKKFLVLSAVTKYEDLKEICEKFKSYDYDEIVFTKTDETEDFGNIFSISYKYGYRVNKLGCGQEVPYDIKNIESAKDIVDIMFA